MPAGRPRAVVRVLVPLARPPVVHDPERVHGLRAPRTFDFVEYGRDAGTSTRESGARFVGDPDGPGAATPFRVQAPDFNPTSLRGKAVLRWAGRQGLEGPPYVVRAFRQAVDLAVANRQVA